MAEQIRNEMFVFDDVVHLEDADPAARAAQRLLEGPGLALKGKPETLCEKFTRNISERAAEDLTEDIDPRSTASFVVETAEAAIVKAVRELADAGEITVARADDELVA